MFSKKLFLALSVPLALLAGACSDSDDDASSADNSSESEPSVTESSGDDQGEEDVPSADADGTTDAAAEAEPTAMSPGSPMGTPPSGDTSELNIAQIAAGTGDVSTLTRLVIKGGLLATVRDDGPFTVFAPTNEAFAALPDGALREISADQAQLADLLTLHVLAGEYTAEDLAGLDGESVETVQGGSLMVEVDGDTITVGGATVEGADVFASNGVIHVVDSVIAEANS